MNRGGEAGAPRDGVRRWPPLWPAALLPLLIGCELTEVTVPVGERRIVVHAVYSRLAPSQFVVVEESVTGAGAGGEGEPGSIPNATPARPVTGATVVFGYASGACAGVADTLPPLADAPGVYQADVRALCRPEAGDVVGLRVVTLDGLVVTGATTLAGARDAFAAVAGDTARAIGEELTLDRERDTLRLAAVAGVARAMQVEIRRPDAPLFAPAAQAPLVFYFITDSLGLSVPGDLVNPFEGDDGENILRAGTIYTVTVAVTDDNYYDFVRSRSDPFTGRGFLNRLEGGLGVFGSVDARTFRLRVVAGVDDPREGEYRLTGMLGGRPVDVTLALYLDDLAPGVFGAFIEGRWYEADIRRSLDGAFFEAGGDPQRFQAGFDVPIAGGDEPNRWGLEGVRAPAGTPFPVRVTGLIGGLTGEVTGTLTAVQVGGPAR